MTRMSMTGNRFIVPGFWTSVIKLNGMELYTMPCFTLMMDYFAVKKYSRKDAKTQRKVFSSRLCESIAHLSNFKSEFNLYRFPF